MNSVETVIVVFNHNKSTNSGLAFKAEVNEKLTSKWTMMGKQYNNLLIGLSSSCFSYYTNGRESSLRFLNKKKKECTREGSEYINGSVVFKQHRLKAP